MLPGSRDTARPRAQTSGPQLPRVPLNLREQDDGKFQVTEQAALEDTHLGTCGTPSAWPSAVPPPPGLPLGLPAHPPGQLGEAGVLLTEPAWLCGPQLWTQQPPSSGRVSQSCAASLQEGGDSGGEQGTKWLPAAARCSGCSYICFRAEGELPGSGGPRSLCYYLGLRGLLGPDLPGWLSALREMPQMPCPFLGPGTRFEGQGTRAREQQSSPGIEAPDLTLYKVPFSRRSPLEEAQVWLNVNLSSAFE